MREDARRIYPESLLIFQRFIHLVRATLRYLVSRRSPGGMPRYGVLFFLLLNLLLFALAWPRSDFEAPAATRLLLDRHGTFLAALEDEAGGGYGYWPLEELPPRVVAATLAIEDRRFWDHPGIDPLAILRALWQNLGSEQRVSGASTLAMQVARMQRPAERTYLSKAMEAATSLIMTARHGRRQVLSHYLRLVPYGNNIHGIAYAARRYFDKPVADLSWAEIAFLSAIPQSPSRMNPYDYYGRRRAERRGRRILALLQRQGVITPADYALAMEQIGALQIPEHRVRSPYAMHGILRLERLLQQEKYRRQGATVLESTLDLELQKWVSRSTQTMLDRYWRPRGAGNAAVIVLDRTSAEVLAWVGSGDYFDERYSGAIDYTQVKRSSGSTLKPFIYALALDLGEVTPASVLADIPVSGVPVRNSDGRYLGPLLPRQALANSRNVPAVELVRSVGLEENYAFLRKLGLHRAERPASHYGLGIAIGSLSVSLEALTEAYTLLANEGVEKPLRWLKGERQTAERRHVSAATARLITLFLADPNARLPGFPRMGALEYPFPVAVKTGTSQGYRDAWTVAYSQRYLVGVWVGDADQQPMRRLGGSSGAAELVQRILLRLHGKQADGLHDLSFPPPQGYRQVRLCEGSGKLAGATCEASYEEWMAPGQIPTEYDSSHRLVVVDRRSGRPADSATPARFRQLKNVRILPPRYAAWGQRSGIEGLTLAARDPLLLASAGTQRVELEILSPRDGARFIRNPEMPANASTIELALASSRSVPQVVWYVDEKPYRVSDYPYRARLELEPGSHVIEARVALTDERSRRVRIEVE